MMDETTLYARYDGPLPKDPPPPPRLDGLTLRLAEIIRARRRAGADETLDAYAHKFNHLVRLEKTGKNGHKSKTLSN